ncbi:hypothetical protein VTP01DRAFT_9933 [Rhizomucor pusillus]|uniref:uncharacterized protein n=1 Tax=Rhizomucor pusillus TaxID=4840 RepID=UPI0037444952
MIMLTFGQAACLVLGEPPENQQEAIEYFRSSRLTVIYLYGEDPLLRPVAIGKKVQELNPYLYRAYPETIPSTPSVSSLPSIPSETTPSTAAEIQSNSQPSTVSVQCASSGIRPPAPSSTTSCKAPLLKRNKVVSVAHIICSVYSFEYGDIASILALSQAGSEYVDHGWIRS